MEAIRFAHQFFHFTLQDWEKLGPQSDQEKAKKLFAEETFSRRSLRGGNAYSFTGALKEFQRIREWEERIGMRTVHQNDPAYPCAIHSHIPPERRPIFLYLRGPCPKEEKEMVAVVGTRYPSDLGLEAAQSFSAFFTVQGLSVVSGLAKGVDTYAHWENIRLGTVAVLGSGVDDVYPAQNQGLTEKIIGAGGTVLSPFPLNQAPLPINFPIRNELIAAMSAGTVVVEGAESSGAAVTAKLALSMGKTVVTLPQDYRTPFGRGAISLHRAGAALVSSEEEALAAIFSRLGGFGKAVPWKENIRKRLFTFAEFMAASGLSVPEALVLLEEGISAGKIERKGPDRYRTVNRT